MRKCNYCGRIYDDTVETCVSCGSNSFQIEVTNEVVVVETPPTEGYHISPDYLRSAGGKDNIALYFGIGVIILDFLIFIPILIAMGGNQHPFSYIVAFLFILVGLIIGIALIVGNSIGNNNKDIRLAKLRYLSKNGRLIKNLPYTIVDSNIEDVKAIQLIYRTPEGWNLTLRSEPKIDGRLADADGRADLLIDPRDYKNYYIDVNIR